MIEINQFILLKSSNSGEEQNNWNRISFTILTTGNVWYILVNQRSSLASYASYVTEMVESTLLFFILS